MMMEDTTKIKVAPAPARSVKNARLTKQIGFVFIFGALLALAALVAIVMGFEGKYQNAIFPVTELQ